MIGGMLAFALATWVLSLILERAVIPYAILRGSPPHIRYGMLLAAFFGIVSGVLSGVADVAHASRQRTQRRRTVIKHLLTN